MEKMIVLLSTYNGEKYLNEQIDSILAQRDVDVVLFVRDDGSGDSTQAILKEYADAGRVVWMNEGEVRNLGFRDSFLLLLREAYERFPDAQYFSFADQDDVWLEDKLKRAVDLISNCQNEKGVLYYSNKTCVDEKLNKILDENIRFFDDYAEVLWGTMASGCTQVFDRKLAAYVNKNEPTCAGYHDSWVYRIAKSIGSEIVFDEESRILYRQHGDNTAGEAAMKECPRRSLKEVLMRVLPFNIPERHYQQRTLQEIYDLYSFDLTQEAREWIELVVGYNKSIKLKWELLTKPEIRKRGGQMRLRWVAKIIFNML